MKRILIAIWIGVCLCNLLVAQHKVDKIIRQGKKNKIREFRGTSKGFRLVDYVNIAGSTYIAVKYDILYGAYFSISYNTMNHRKGVWSGGLTYIKDKTYTKRDDYALLGVAYHPLLWSIPVIDVRAGIGAVMGYQHEQNEVLNTHSGYYALGGHVGLDMTCKLSTYVQLSAGVIQYMLFNNDLGIHHLFFYQAGIKLYL